MRSLAIVALLAALGCGCSSTTQHRWQERSTLHVGTLSTSDLALALLEAEDALARSWRVDGEAVEVAEARRRVQGLPAGGSLQLTSEAGGALIDLRVTGDGALVVSSRCRWQSGIRTR